MQGNPEREREERERERERERSRDRKSEKQSDAQEVQVSAFVRDGIWVITLLRNFENTPYEEKKIRKKMLFQTNTI